MDGQNPILTIILTLWAFEWLHTKESPSLNGILGDGAGEGNRTLVSGLGSPRSTIEPHPRVQWLLVADVDAGDKEVLGSLRTAKVSKRSVSGSGQYLRRS